MSFFGYIDINTINSEGLGIDDESISGGSKKTKSKSIKIQHKIKKNKKIDEEKSDNINETKTDNQVNDNTNNIKLDKKQEEMRISELLKEDIKELSKEEYISYLNEYYDKYVTYVKIVHEDYKNIKIPVYITEEKIPEIKVLHIVNDIRKINRIINSPQINGDYNKNNELKAKNKQIMSNSPSLNNSLYKQTMTNLSLLDFKELHRLINKYNYNELFKVIKYRLSKYDIKIEHNSKILCKRYWVNGMNQYKNLVYDKNVYSNLLNRNNGINNEFITKTNTIIYENEDKIFNELKRYINTDPTDNNDKYESIKITSLDVPSSQTENSSFVNAYNKYIENRIEEKLVRCTTTPVKTIINITEQLINSIDIDSLIQNTNNKYEMIDKILQQIRVYLVDALYNLNSSIKNKRELYFANAKIIFDVSNRIQIILNNEFYNQDIKFPIDTFEKKTEAYGKIKLIVNKSINESGVKNINRSVEQTICI